MAGGAAALALTVAGWWFWREREPLALFRRLPAENLLLLHLDVDALRRAPGLAPLAASGIAPDPDYVAFVRQTGFDYQRDLDQAAVCYLPDRVYVLARGRFQPDRLRQYALAQGGSCAGGKLEQPCQMPASRPDRRISFLLLSPRVLALATAPESDAVRQLQSEPAVHAVPLARAVVARNPGALLWVTAAPAALGPALPSNLSLLGPVLAKAQRAHLFVNDQSGSLRVVLEADCASEPQAGETRRLLQGVHDLIGGLLRGQQPPNEWQRVLSSARIDQQGNTVRAAWILDPEVLKRLGGP